ncbi:hypothetical protein, partial [Azospirillum doebereinerae]|uniref:hypothetical protein n=1 Tax=Azospirillum doebereinerae TaxID=92933 RepID=UPI003D207313
MYDELIDFIEKYGKTGIIKCLTGTIKWSLRAPNKRVFWLLRGYGTPPRPGSALVDHRTVVA